VSTPRHRIEQASIPALTLLSRLPGWVPFLAVLGVMLAGIFIPTWGWLLLLVVVAFLVWTLYLAWPALDNTNRLMRGTVILLAVAITITQAFPRT
jgi:hypothetical protein